MGAPSGIASWDRLVRTAAERSPPSPLPTPAPPAPNAPGAGAGGPSSSWLPPLAEGVVGGGRRARPPRRPSASNPSALLPPSSSPLSPSISKETVGAKRRSSRLSGLTAPIVRDAETRLQPSAASSVGRASSTSRGGGERVGRPASSRDGSNGLGGKRPDQVGDDNADLGDRPGKRPRTRKGAALAAPAVASASASVAQTSLAAKEDNPVADARASSQPSGDPSGAARASTSVRGSLLGSLPVAMASRGSITPEDSPISPSSQPPSSSWAARLFGWQSWTTASATGETTAAAAAAVARLASPGEENGRGREKVGVEDEHYQDSPQVPSEGQGPHAGDAEGRRRSLRRGLSGLGLASTAGSMLKPSVSGGDLKETALTGDDSRQPPPQQQQQGVSRRRKQRDPQQAAAKRHTGSGVARATTSAKAAAAVNCPPVVAVAGSDIPGGGATTPAAVAVVSSSTAVSPSGGGGFLRGAVSAVMQFIGSGRTPIAAPRPSQQQQQHAGEVDVGPSSADLSSGVIPGRGGPDGLPLANAINATTNNNRQATIPPTHSQIGTRAGRLSLTLSRGASAEEASQPGGDHAQLEMLPPPPPLPIAQLLAGARQRNVNAPGQNMSRRVGGRESAPVMQSLSSSLGRRARTSSDRNLPSEPGSSFTMSGLESREGAVPAPQGGRRLRLRGWNGGGRALAVRPPLSGTSADDGSKEEAVLRRQQDAGYSVGKHREGSEEEEEAEDDDIRRGYLTCYEGHHNTQGTKNVSQERQCMGCTGLGLSKCIQT